MVQQTSSDLQLRSDLHSLSASPGSVHTDSVDASVVRRHASPLEVLQSLSAPQKRGQFLASVQALPSPKSQHNSPFEVLQSPSPAQAFRHLSSQTPSPEPLLGPLPLLLPLEQPCAQAKAKAPRTSIDPSDLDAKFMLRIRAGSQNVVNGRSFS